MGPIGLYVHVPFCASKCGYCDFYSETTREGKDAYLQVLGEEIRSYAGRGITADSLFVGGGTPSMLTAGELGDILDACREVFGLTGECTLEANPDSVSPEFLREVLEKCRREGIHTALETSGCASRQVLAGVPAPGGPVSLGL